MRTRAAIYTRISLDREGRSAAPERQEADCRALVSQRGWEVAGVYADRDTSAYSRRVTRPAFDKLLADLRAGTVDAVLVWKMDRLTRQGITGISRFLEVLEEASAELVSATEPFLDTTTPMGRGVLGLIASMAEQESANISLRVKRAHESSAANGKMHGGGSRQYGLSRDGKLVLEEAGVIREAMERVLAGESLRQIAGDLNARGVPTTTAGERRKPRPGQVVDPKRLGEDGRYELRGEWRSVSLGQMLRSPRLAGVRVLNGGVNEKGDWDPIVTPEEHSALLRALARPRRGPRAANRSYLLSGAGVIRCALCERPMRRMSFRMANGRLSHRYQCARQPGQDQCGKVAITQTSTDEYVVGELLDFLAYAELRPLEGDESETELESRLAEARGAVGELVQERFVRRRISRQDFDAAHQPLEAEVENLEARLEAIRRRREERAAQIRLGDREALGAWWEAASDPEKIATVRQAITEVKVKPAARRGGNHFDPGRLDIEWDWKAFRLTDAGRRLERFWRRDDE
jgi:site-specific DNA recombinase